MNSFLMAQQQAATMHRQKWSNSLYGTWSETARSDISCI